MKTTWSRMTVILAFAAVAASAQSRNNNAEVMATIPFEFHIGKAVLPPGQYAMTRPTSTMISLISVDRQHVATMSAFAAPVNEDGKAWLVFQRYGDQYFFSKAVNDRFGLEVAKSKMEREIASKMTQPKATMIALRRK